MSENAPELQLPDLGTTRALRLTIRNVVALNLSYFGIEFVVALAIGSVALFADSVDFLEDGAVNILILAGLGFSASRRAKLGMLLAAIILVPALATLWTAWHNYTAGLVPNPVALSIAGLGALVVNFVCARMLAPFRTVGGSLTRAAFLSARNDVIANVAIVAAGLLTAATSSGGTVVLMVIASSTKWSNAIFELAETEFRDTHGPFIFWNTNKH